jgi:glutathione synthase
MRVGFVVNDRSRENPKYTTVGLAHAAERLGHEAWFINVVDFTYDPDGSVCAHAARIEGDFDDQEHYFAALKHEDNECERVEMADLDVLFLRHDPAEEADRRAWAQYSPILFGQLAARAGTVVLNDPMALASALNKTYFQQFPEIVRPRTLISRNKQEIWRFIEEQRGTAVLKPLQGSGGRNVFLVKNGEVSNLNQITEVIAEQGYVVVQEYLEEAVNGDVRLFVMNGQPLCVDGRCAALRRVNANGDMRSNIHAGGKPEAVEVTPEMMRLVETVRPKLVKDGMFLVGLDIVGDKLMEVNVFSPGGLHTLSGLYGVDFFKPVIEALERKANVRSHYRKSIDNIELATL